MRSTGKRRKTKKTRENLGFFDRHLLRPEHLAHVDKKDALLLFLQCSIWNDKTSNSQYNIYRKYDERRYNIFSKNVFIIFVEKHKQQINN